MPLFTPKYSDVFSSPQTVPQSTSTDWINAISNWINTIFGRKESQPQASPPQAGVQPNADNKTFYFILGIFIIAIIAIVAMKR